MNEYALHHARRLERAGVLFDLAECDNWLRDRRVSIMRQLYPQACVGGAA